MILKSDAKFEEKLICCFKIFIRALKVSNICTLIGPFRAKYISFNLRYTQEFFFMTLKSHAKFEEKSTSGFKNYLRNLANFHQNTWKCQNWYFHGILLSKVENVWAKNLQRSYVEWHWRMMKNLKRIWLVVSKLT